MQPASSQSLTVVRATGASPGAVAVIQLAGAGAHRALAEISGREDWPIGAIRLTDLAGIDRGLAVRLSESAAVLMPHGGVRIVQRLLARLRALGATEARADDVDPLLIYPEAADRVEALALAAMPRLAGDLGLDLLLDQPQRWRGVVSISDADRARAARLNRLFTPPLVVLAGPANVGKSTLSNRLAGRPLAIATDLPGTTRDYISASIDMGGVVVNWIDTPGLREDADTIERNAIEVAQLLLACCDYLIAITDHQQQWPTLPRDPDLRIANKCDLRRRPDAELAISATTGEGIDGLVNRVRESLVPAADLMHPGPWLFDPRLESASARSATADRHQ